MAALRNDGPTLFILLYNILAISGFQSVCMVAVTTFWADVTAWYKVSIHAACEACIQTSADETAWAKNYREVCVANLLYHWKVRSHLA